MPRSKRKSFRNSRGHRRNSTSKLDTVFECLVCSQGKTVQCKLNRNEMIGSLTCTICGSTYSCTINQLSREVDIYSEWVDTFEYASNSEVVKPTPSFRTIHRHHSERSLSETLEGFQNLEIDNERAQAQVHTRASTQSKNQPTTTDTIIIEKQLLRAKDRQRKYFKKLDETHVQVKGQGDQTFDDLSWDYSTLDGADLDDVDLDNSDLDEDHYESGDSHS